MNLYISGGLLRAHATNGPFYTPKVVAMHSLVAVARNDADVGRYQIVSIVDIKGTPNTPVSRRVLLLDARSKRIIAETWSDTVGRYGFYGLAAGIYDVIAYDHTGKNRAVIADGIPAEPMP